MWGAVECLAPPSASDPSPKPCQPYGTPRRAYSAPETIVLSVFELAGRVLWLLSITGELDAASEAGPWMSTKCAPC